MSLYQPNRSYIRIKKKAPVLMARRLRLLINL